MVLTVARIALAAVLIALLLAAWVVDACAAGWEPDGTWIGQLSKALATHVVSSQMVK